MTILEAAIQVLNHRGGAMSVKEIYDAIIATELYQFGAKSPRSVLSGTLRNHLKTSPQPRISEVSKGVVRAS